MRAGEPALAAHDPEPLGVESSCQGAGVLHRGSGIRLAEGRHFGQGHRERGGALVVIVADGAVGEIVDAGGEVVIVRQDDAADRAGKGLVGWKR